MARPKAIIHEVEQRSEDWFKLRLGKVTGSNAKKIYYSISDTARLAAIRQILGIEKVTKQIKLSTEFYELWERTDPVDLLNKAGMELPETVERKNYREGIVAERLTGLQADPEPYVSYDMKWGIVNEDIAKTVYQMEKRSIVEKAPFFEHPKLKAGVSPDGIVTDIDTGEVGLCEVKCLRSANHLFKIIYNKEVPDEFLDQIQMQMWLTGYDWCDFIGYDSRVPNGLQIHIQRVVYDEKYIEEKFEPALKQFLKECDNDFKHFWAMVKDKKMFKTNLGYN